jgi:hypothetical protein
MASGKIRVKAGANGPVILPSPVDGLTRVGDEPVELETTRFLRGRLAVGDLVEVPAVNVPPAAVPPMPGTGVIIAVTADTKKDEE